PATAQARVMREWRIGRRGARGPQRPIAAVRWADNARLTAIARALAERPSIRQCQFLTNWPPLHTRARPSPGADRGPQARFAGTGRATGRRRGARASARP